jgi:mannose-6-phosphate isomerase-like protein (cupin superfamily)
MQGIGYRDFDERGLKMGKVNICVETLNEGEFIIVPRGVEHCPRAEEEVHVLLFEPASTLNTGEAESELTVRELEEI